jgi:hypothetical protein
MDAPRPPAPQAHHSPAPKTQRKSRQQKPFSYVRRAKKRVKNRQNGLFKELPIDLKLAKTPIDLKTIWPRRVD